MKTITCAILSMILLGLTHFVMSEDNNSFNDSAARNSTYLDNLERLWPGGKIPYEFQNDFLPEEIQEVHKGMSLIASLTCLTFEERMGQKDWVLIKKEPEGCFASYGRQGGRQVLNLQIACIEVVVATRMLLRTAGVPIESNRPDRDDYIYVNFTNIEPEQHMAFRKYPGEVFAPYDFESIMHFPGDRFAIDPRYPAIFALDNPSRKLGGENVTELDALKVIRE